MANQITHIVFAEKVYPKYFSHFDRMAFVIGTVFPDIRYLGVIERDKTHYKNISLEDILGSANPFEAGLKYHSLVDQVREAFMVQNDLYALTPQSKFITQAIKCLEDEITYREINDWPHITSYFDTVLDQERAYPIPEDAIKKWHQLLQEYFASAPTDETRKKFILSLGFPEDVCQEINGLVSTMRSNDKIIERIHDLNNQWLKLIDS